MKFVFSFSTMYMEWTCSLSSCGSLHACLLPPECCIAWMVVIMSIRILNLYKFPIWILTAKICVKSASLLSSEGLTLYVISHDGTLGTKNQESSLQSDHGIPEAVAWSWCQHASQIESAIPYCGTVITLI